MCWECDARWGGVKRRSKRKKDWCSPFSIGAEIRAAVQKRASGAKDMPCPESIRSPEEPYKVKAGRGNVGCDYCKKRMFDPAHSELTPTAEEAPFVLRKLVALEASSARVKIEPIDAS